MKYEPLPLQGAFLIELEPTVDERGFFARTFCREEFSARGLNFTIEQCSVSFNSRKGTLRGMHFQKNPHEEVKVVRCTHGSIYDVIIDLRPDSVTFTRWAGIELNAANHKAIYIPEGFAHGFLTLAEKTEVLYQMSQPFHPKSAAGVRWDDPVFAINWPNAIDVISERDNSYPDFRP
ncbi:MAG: dTDP-4-dehydrorhamnose 3,5-epimerase [Gammaproteobacteria bacterium]